MGGRKDDRFHLYVQQEALERASKRWATFCTLAFRHF